ncbi:MAG: aldo/keto reductase [Armatimonadota bacterium]
MHTSTIPGISLPISRLVQGTIMIGSHDIEGGFNLLDSAFDKGCNAFDTAHVYGGGDNERTVGRWVNDRGIRDKVVIIGKGAHHNTDRNRVTPWDITSDIYDSLARFKTDYIDLYLLHRDDPAFPVEPIVEVLNEHQQAGHIKAFGGSNWSHQRIQAANEYAMKNGLMPFVASSPHFSLAVQHKEPWDNCVTITRQQDEEAREWYKSTQLPVLAWSSVAAGFFSGRFRRDNIEGLTDGYDQMCVHCYAYEDNFQRLDRAAELAKQKGVSANQIAFAWVMRQPYNLFALVGSRTPEEFQQNLDAMELPLTPAEMAWLNLSD